MTEETGADVGLKIAGQEINLKNVKSLNTIATVTTLIVSCIVAYVIITHNAEARDGGKEVAAVLKETNKETAAVLRETNRELKDAIKEMAKATREQSCLLSLPQDRRQENIEVCKRLSR